jgi:hypothetical protein
MKAKHRSKTDAQRTKIPKLPANSSAFQSTRWSRADLNASNAFASAPFKTTKGASGECPASIYVPHGTSTVPVPLSFRTGISRLNLVQDVAGNVRHLQLQPDAAYTCYKAQYQPLKGNGVASCLCHSYGRLYAHGFFLQDSAVCLASV